MEEQIEEGDVLGTEAWNGEYDIAEEEEERLLEEQEDPTDQGGEQAYYDGEYEASEVEEDVLDIGLNDDIIEFEEQEVSRISPVVSKANSVTPQQQVSIGSNQQPAGTLSSANNAAQSSGITKGKEEPRYVQQVLPRKHFSPRHPGFTPRNGIPNSQFQHRPNFGNRPPHRPSFNNQQPPFVGRKPSLMDMRGVPNAFMGRIPFEDHHPFPRSMIMQNNPPVNMLNQQHFLEPPDRGNNRCFINPHYKGSVMNAQGPHPQQSQRIPPGPDFGPFGQTMNKGPPQPPPSLFRPGPPNPPLNPPNQPRTRLPNVRFPPPINVPPPQSTGQRGPTNSMTSRPPSTSSAPPQLMDVILVPPGFRNESGPPFFGERPPRAARFRFDSFPQQALHQPEHHEPLGPPPRSFLAPPPAAHPPIKRPHPAIELPVAGIPFKQLRSSGPVQSEVFHANRPPSVRPLMVAPRVRVPPERPHLTQFRPPVTVAPPISHPRPVHSAPVTTGTATMMKPAVTASSAIAAPPTAPVTPAESFVIDKTPSAVPSTEETEQLPEEMKEYLQKMEEQRKKREEVLKMKEERRRQMLASSPTAPSASESQDSSKGPTEPPVKTKTQGVVNPIQTIQNGQVVPTAPTQAVPSTDSQNLANRAKLPFRTGVNQVAPSAPARKTLLVKPTPTVTNTVVSPSSSIIGSSGPSTATSPPAAAPATSGTGTTAGSKRRFKIIIIKNKNGDVLEKRYVPIEGDVGSGSGSSAAAAANRLVISRPTDRASQTVAIENLNPNSTEKDVRNLCEYFGPVQEIYPKLQEGKAIVRFTSASAAEHFVHNHNTPGICVQFV